MKNIPEDVWLIILRYLKPSELKIASLVSKQFEKLSNKVRPKLAGGDIEYFTVGDPIKLTMTGIEDLVQRVYYKNTHSRRYRTTISSDEILASLKKQKVIKVFKDFNLAKEYALFLANSGHGTDSDTYAEYGAAIFTIKLKTGEHLVNPLSNHPVQKIEIITKDTIPVELRFGPSSSEMMFDCYEIKMNSIDEITQASLFKREPSFEEQYNDEAIFVYNFNTSSREKLCLIM